METLKVFGCGKRENRRKKKEKKKERKKDAEEFLCSECYAVAMSHT